MAELINEVKTLTCYHCGDPCEGKEVLLNDKIFCCEGCKLVYGILEENDLCSYYNLEDHPGVSLKGKNFGDKYAFLRNEEILHQLLDFASDRCCKITLYIPSIHCSSCIWLLENLHKLRDGVSSSRVNFMRKELAISYDPTVVSLQQLVELIATLGYAPDISLENYTRKTKHKNNQSIFLKLGIVGFCTGNIMLLSFPEYFGLDAAFDAQFGPYFLWLNVLLSLPVYFYGASGYLASAYQALRKKIINIDVPISIGISALFIRSLFDSLAGAGPGYWDSLAGLVFFLLVGKWLQNKTYENLSFERNYSSYFPLAATLLVDGKQENVPVTDLAANDAILIRNQELIPADSVLLSPKAWIDYSFVTGESEPVEKKAGDHIYAGGRQIGAHIQLSIQKPVSQSYLTQLWNNEAFSKEKATPVTRLAADFSKYFTYITLSVAALTAISWYFIDQSVMWNAFTAVLIVACPCALTLSMPFTMENTMRIFGNNGFYVKNPDVIQHLATITHVVFDKTGTLTKGKSTEITYTGNKLNAEEQRMVSAITANSTHPLSRKLFNYFADFSPVSVTDFQELTGAGITGTVLGKNVKVGSRGYLGLKGLKAAEKTGAKVHLSIDNVYKGCFTYHNPYRTGLQEIIDKIKKGFNLSLLSGDHKVDLSVLLPLFGSKENMFFEQSPSDKLNYIQRLQQRNEKVLMVGDGLNDAGALKQSDVGMVLTEDVHAFFPACDVLADASKFTRLYDIIRFSRTSVNIVKVSFLLSMVYNFIGVGWAISGNLSPVFAAIFMPASSISVVAFAVGVSSLYGRWRKFT